MVHKFEKRSLLRICLGYHLMSGERFYGDYLVAPLIDFGEPPTGGGFRICRIAEIIIDKAEYYKFPLRESKDKGERSLENIEINYTHMFDNKTEDNTPILKELGPTINKEPTLDELDEEDRLEFPNNATWAFTAEERARERDKVMLEEPVLTEGGSSSGTTGRA